MSELSLMMKVTGEDSGRSFSPRRMRLAVMKAAPSSCIETARGLDLGQFLTGRNIDAERLLDGGFLRVARLDQIDPYGALAR